jgi:FMN-dependent NADH-azoreductase
MQTTLLHIDASPRRESHSRRLAAEFVAAWQARRPQAAVVHREIGREPIPHLSEAWIAAAFTPPAQRTPEASEALAVSEVLVDELLAARRLVIATPMYNFGVPSALKAWIDQVVRVGRTFAFDAAKPNPYEGLVRDVRALIVTARGDGGYVAGGRNAGRNFADLHLREVLRFMGITDTRVVAVEQDEFGGAALERSIGAARDELSRLAETF